MDLSFLTSKQIGVLGLGKTGLATADFFMRQGFNVIVWDDSDDKQDEALQKKYNVKKFTDVNWSPNDIVIWSPGIPHYGPKAHPYSQFLKECGVSFVSDMDIFCRAMPHHDVVAITGTNGKSTTTALMTHTLKQFRACEMGGNIGAPVLTLPELPRDGTYVFECSSYQLELTPHLTPVASVLLNITPDHLARHGDMDGYIKAKENIFQRTRSDAAPHVAIICQDTPEACAVSDRITMDGKWNVIPISVQQELNHGVCVDTQGNLKDQGVVICNFHDHPVLKGDHNFENMAAVYATIKYVYGYESLAIWNAMLSFGGLPHRQFMTRQIGHVQFINDSKATNADAAEKALKSYDRIYWIAGGQAKEGGLTGLEPYFDRIVHTALIGEASDEFAKFLDQYKAPYTKLETLDRAVVELWARAAQDPKPSVILLSPACASWDQFQSFEHRGNLFEQYANAIEPMAQKKVM